MSDRDNDTSAPSKSEPGAEAAEPSPGETPRDPAPSRKELKDVDRMYEEDAAKAAEDKDKDKAQDN